MNASPAPAPRADETTLTDDQLALVVGGIGGDNLRARALLRALRSGTPAHGLPLGEREKSAGPTRG